jgi:hypothetical protein
MLLLTEKKEDLLTSLSSRNQDVDEELLGVDAHEMAEDIRQARRSEQQHHRYQYNLAYRAGQDSIDKAVTVWMMETLERGIMDNSLCNNSSMQYKTRPIAGARTPTSTLVREVPGVRVASTSAQVADEETRAVMRVIIPAGAGAGSKESEESESEADSDDLPLYPPLRTGSPRQGKGVSVKLHAVMFLPSMPRLCQLTSIMIRTRGPPVQSFAGHTDVNNIHDASTGIKWLQGVSKADAASPTKKRRMIPCYDPQLQAQQRSALPVYVSRDKSVFLSFMQRDGSAGRLSTPQAGAGGHVSCSWTGTTTVDKKCQGWAGMLATATRHVISKNLHESYHSEGGKYG